jgi:hypothetical protein
LRIRIQVDRSRTDRASMIEAAEDEELRPGSTVVEATAWATRPWACAGCRRRLPRRRNP